MEKHLFCVYDAAAGAYLDPFVAPSVEFALREFRRAANEQGHQFNRYPADFTLFHCGKFDPVSGKLTGGMLHSLGVAITLIDRMEVD